MKGIKTAALIGAVLMLYSVGAAAQLTNQGMLDQVVTEFATRASSWQSVVMNAALWLFWTLGTISLVWTGGMLILRKADIGEFFAEFVRFILFFGFFLWLLRNGPAFASSIIRSLQKLGEQASGVSSVTPSSIVDIGFMIWKQAIISLSLWTPIDSFVGIALSAGIMLLLAAVAVNMLLLLVAGWILMYAGIFFLGFGGSRWTSDLAINYYKAVLGVAVQLMAMVLLIGIGNDLLSTFYAKMNKGALNFEELGVMLVFCFALLMLINRVPSLLAGVITGSGSGGAGNCQWRSKPADSWRRSVGEAPGEGWSVVETDWGFGAAGSPMMRQGGVLEGARRATGDTPPCRAPAIGEACRSSAKGATRR